MKRKTFINLPLVAVLVISMALIPGKIFAASSDFPDYFTMGENDTVRLSASDLGGYVTLPVRAHFSDLVLRWYIEFTFPSGMTPVFAERTPAMDVHYLDSLGQDQVCHVALTQSDDWTYLSAYVNAQCYYEPWGNGVYIPFGNATWAIGDYDEMFLITFLVDESFKQGILAMDCHYTIKRPNGAGNQTSMTMSYAPVTVMVDYLPGDVNGDGLVNITDATELINRLLNESFDIPTPACDVNGDSEVNITDATELINRLLNE